jgi:cytochrome c-type biogenesis protein CcmH/NrfG
MPPSKEHLVEANALDAWMRAVEDPQVGPKALAFAEKAAAHFPNNSRILFYLGCLCAQQGREGRAHACLARALELDPDHDEAQRELGLLRARRSGRSGALPRVDVPRKGRKAR